MGAGVSGCLFKISSGLFFDWFTQLICVVSLRLKMAGPGWFLCFHDPQALWLICMSALRKDSGSPLHGKTKAVPLEAEAQALGSS